MYVACSYCGGHGVIWWKPLIGVPAKRETCTACTDRRFPTYARLRRLAIEVGEALGFPVQLPEDA